MQPQANPGLAQHPVGNNVPRPLVKLPTSPQLNTTRRPDPAGLTNPGRVGGLTPSRGNAPALGRMGSPATSHSVFKPTPAGPHPSPFPQGPKTGVTAPTQGQSVFSPIPQRQGPGTRHPNSPASNTLKG